MAMVAGKTSVTDAEFDRMADQALGAVERALDRIELDIDVQRKGAGVLEIEFADGSKVIVNRHAAAREIWVAARAGGFHFRHGDGAWRDTRDGTELFAALSRIVSAQGGAAVILASD
jgi:CyaY protein